jgi:hypothetical protein
LLGTIARLDDYRPVANLQLGHSRPVLGMVYRQPITELGFPAGNLLPDPFRWSVGRWCTAAILTAADDIVHMSRGAGLQQFVYVGFPVTDLNYLLMGLVLEAGL